MPFGDGTGPLGQGCAGGGGRNAGRKNGNFRGTGRQAGFRRGGGTGVCRGFRFFNANPNAQDLNASEALKDRIQLLENQLDSLKEKLKETESE